VEGAGFGLGTSWSRVRAAVDVGTQPEPSDVEDALADARFWRRAGLGSAVISGAALVALPFSEIWVETWTDDFDAVAFGAGFLLVIVLAAGLGFFGLGYRRVGRLSAYSGAQWRGNVLASGLAHVGVVVLAVVLGPLWMLACAYIPVAIAGTILFAMGVPVDRLPATFAYVYTALMSIIGIMLTLRVAYRSWS
jgi:hypothetical protein